MERRADIEAGTEHEILVINAKKYIINLTVRLKKQIDRGREKVADKYARRFPMFFCAGRKFYFNESNYVIGNS